MASSMFTRPHLGQMQKGTLVDICRVHGMPQAGTKAALVDRICSAQPAVHAVAAEAFADQAARGIISSARSA